MKVFSQLTEYKRLRAVTVEVELPTDGVDDVTVILSGRLIEVVSYVVTPPTGLWQANLFDDTGNDLLKSLLKNLSNTGPESRLVYLSTQASTFSEPLVLVPQAYRLQVTASAGSRVGLRFFLLR